MTSKNSFWANCRENHKRRIWVWIVAALLQLLCYGGMTMIYLSRIRQFRADGQYKTEAAFLEAMRRAAQDALGFSDNIYPVTICLSAIIAMQGFSYLYHRRKVDLYHSVPVSKDRRFAVIYTNGILIYFASNLCGLLLGTLLAASQGAVNATVLTAAGLAFLWNLWVFFLCYHMMLLAVMLTGNRFVTVCVFLAFLLYEMGACLLFDSLRTSYFKTAGNFFTSVSPKLSLLYDCASRIWGLKNASGMGEAARQAFPLMGKWAVLALLFLGLSRFAYQKRASEAAGKAMAFSFMKPLFKVAVAIPVGLLVGELVYDLSYRNETLQALGMLAGALLFSAAMEVLYEFDIKSLFRHLPSTGAALLSLLAIFCVYKWDLFGYDSYIPAQNKVESVAISMDGYYDNYWGKDMQYVGSGDYLRDTMFLTDTEPVLSLAKAYQGADAEAMKDPREFRVLYRLRSGAERERRFQVDYDDPKAEALLNQIFLTEAYRESTYQFLINQEFDGKITRIAYRNGAAEGIIPVEEAARLREAWAKDMERADFTLMRHNRPCGRLVYEYGYNQKQWQVYESFENTIALLKELDAYYPVQLNAEDVASVTVHNFHPEMQGQEEDAVDAPAAVDADYTVSETFYDESQIEEILSGIHPLELYSNWCSGEDMEAGYEVNVAFKRDSSYPYLRGSYYVDYTFYAGKVPAFVQEATAYKE